MSGFDSIDETIKDKLIAKKYDRISRLPPLNDKERWDRLMVICDLQDYEINEILNAIINPSPQQGM
jgi:hypothetical protein